MELGIAESSASLSITSGPLTACSRAFAWCRRLVRKKVPLEGGCHLTLATDEQSSKSSYCRPGLVDESGACLALSIQVVFGVPWLRSETIAL